MVAVPFVGAWVDQQREGRRQRRNGRIVERAHREDRVAR
jgi:hypothetical protein